MRVMQNNPRGLIWENYYWEQFLPGWVWGRCHHEQVLNEEYNFNANAENPHTCCWELNKSAPPTEEKETWIHVWLNQYENVKD